MKITLPLRVPSDNEIWGFANGKRYKTAVYKQFQQDALWILKAYPKQTFTPRSPLFVAVTHYWQRAGVRDVWNPLKAIGDILEASGIIYNDKDIWDSRVRKIKINKDEPERTEIEIHAIDPQEG